MIHHPTPVEVAQVRAVVAPIVGDTASARLITNFAIIEHFAKGADFDVNAFRSLVPHGDVAKEVRMARIAAGMADNHLASDAGVRALDAARAKVTGLFGDKRKTA